MEERQQTAAHKMMMGERSRLQMTGIKDVISFDADEIILETECGLLLIKGRELHMSRLSLEKEEVNVDGTIDSLIYSDTAKPAKKAEHLFGRLFR